MKPANAASLLALSMLLPCPISQSATIGYDHLETVFSTKFEPSEGYDQELTLSGQNGWVAYGDGGNGLNYFQTGEGLQGYIGYDNPDPGASNGYSSVYRPFSLSGFTDSSPIATFRITMEIVDSTNQNRDIFGWTFYNLEQEPRPLFSLHFDNETRLILYDLGSDGDAVSTGFAYEHGDIYDLEVCMNFVLNRWSATMGESVIARDLPIASQGAELSLSSVEAFWAIIDLDSPGDNFLIFDNYSIVREGPSGPAPRAELLGFHPGVGSILSLHGQPGASYHLEASLDLENWIRIHTGAFSPEDGQANYIDAQALLVSSRFYRVLRAQGSP